MSKLRQVLLVDDYEADNFLNKMLFEELDCAEHIEIAYDGTEALTYLTTPVDGKHPQPELICLDINMPIMNGWEFLEAYEALPEEQRGGVIVMMLTTSQNPDDSKKALSRKAVAAYTTKPLTRPILKSVLQEHFPGRF